MSGPARLFPGIGHIKADSSTVSPSPYAGSHMKYLGTLVQFSDDCKVMGPYQAVAD